MSKTETSPAGADRGEHAIVLGAAALEAPTPTKTYRRKGRRVAASLALTALAAGVAIPTAACSAAREATCATPHNAYAHDQPALIAEVGKIAGTILPTLRKYDGENETSSGFIGQKIPTDNGGDYYTITLQTPSGQGKGGALDRPPAANTTNPYGLNQVIVATHEVDPYTGQTTTPTEYDLVYGLYDVGGCKLNFQWAITQPNRGGNAYLAYDLNVLTSLANGVVNRQIVSG